MDIKKEIPDIEKFRKLIYWSINPYQTMDKGSDIILNQCYEFKQQYPNFSLFPYNDENIPKIIEFYRGKNIIPRLVIDQIHLYASVIRQKS